MNLPKKDKHYVSALRYNWLTSFYDPLIQWTIQEKKFKRQLVKQSNIQPGHRVLDLGCGTATLTMLIKQMHPDAEVIGVDGDDKVLDIAHRKVHTSGLEIQLQKGLSYKMGLPDHSFNRVLSSLLFHHLTSENKRKTLEEIHRVLKPGGELHLADWGEAQNILMRAAFLLVQILDGFATTNDNVQGKLLDYICQTGYNDAKVKQNFKTIFGTLTIYTGTRV